MKKLIVMATLVLATATVFARPHGPGGGHRPAPPPPMHHGHHGAPHGYRGCGVAAGFIGGVIGGAIARTIVEPAPVVVTTPTVVATPVATTPVVVAPVTQVQNVWVEGRYVDQIQANGTVVRIWQPGHYEQRTVVIQ